MERDRPYYSLRKVKNLANSGEWIINANARTTAKDDFGWNRDDIKKAVSKLQQKHFYKSATRYDDPGIYVDYYKAYQLMGEDVYLHFRVEDDCLIICSFKEI
jgi:hypothetical protein